MTCLHERIGVIKVWHATGASPITAMRTPDGRGQIGDVYLQVCLNLACRMVMLSHKDVASLLSVKVEYDYTDKPVTCGAPLPFGEKCSFTKGHESSGDPLERLHGVRGGDAECDA